jgi:hypothetical protein
MQLELFMVIPDWEHIVFGAGEWVFWNWNFD